MSALNRPDNFTGRVNYAAAVISSGRRTTRSFDNCFENHDGDAVAAALVRRAEKNERLRTNLPRYINADMAYRNHADYQGRDLKEVSRELRLRGKWEFHFTMNARSVGELEEMAGIQDRAEFWRPFAELANCIDMGCAKLKRMIIDQKVAEGIAP